LNAPTIGGHLALPWKGFASKPCVLSDRIQPVTRLRLLSDLDSHWATWAVTWLHSADGLRSPAWCVQSVIQAIRNTRVHLSAPLPALSMHAWQSCRYSKRSICARSLARSLPLSDLSLSPSIPLSDLSLSLSFSLSLSGSDVDSQGHALSWVDSGRSPLRICPSEFGSSGPCLGMAWADTDNLV